MVGIDEAGRGAWAGPLCAAAVQLLKPIKGLADSKNLTASKREQLFEKICANAVIGVGWASNNFIDKCGLTKAQTKAMADALAQVQSSGAVVVDGKVNYLQHLPNTQAIVDADAKIAEVMAASIVAKVLRDRFMNELNTLHVNSLQVNYRFDAHKGYGTKQHMQMLVRHGVSNMHRKSYKPVAGTVR